MLHSVSIFKLQYLIKANKSSKYAKREGGHLKLQFWSRCPIGVILMNNVLCVVFCFVEKIFQCAISLPVLNQRPDQWTTIGEMVTYAKVSVDIGRGETHIISMS